MKTERAKQLIGQMVMSCDAGFKMIKKSPNFHGPYRLLNITKEGFAILEGRPTDLRINTSLLEEINE